MTFDTDPENCVDALSRLSVVGFSETAVRDRLGLDDLNDLQMRAAAIYRRQRLKPRDPLASAIDLFLLQGWLPASELDQLFSRRDQDALVECCLLERSGGLVRALVSLYPVGRDLIFSDHVSVELETNRWSEVPPDRVMYVGTDSRWLARITSRKPVASALDLCCGSGVHALLAASHAEQVTAVDINPRAVRCTVFNARVQSRSNVQVLLGDVYAPIASRRFDLITANPPFVPAPAQRVGFRDGGPTGEDVQRRIVEGLPLHLSPGGMAQLVTEFGDPGREPLEGRLRRWLGDAPMDIYVLRLRAHSAQTYAIGHAEGNAPDVLLESVGQWAANLESQLYRTVVSVLVTIQWSDGTPWTRGDEASPPTGSAGAEVEAVLAAERLARDPGLTSRLRESRVARTGPVGVFQSRTLGAIVPPTAQARRLGMAISIAHDLGPVELDLLAALEQPIATGDILAMGESIAVPHDVTLGALVSLIRKGLVRTVS